MSCSHCSGGSFGNKLFWLLAGVALGVLYAPQEGSKSRTLLRQKAVDLNDELADVLEDTFPLIKSRIKDMAYKVEDSAKQATKSVNQGKKVLKQKITQGKTLVKSTRKDLKKGTLDLREKVDEIKEDVKTRIARKQGADV